MAAPSLGSSDGVYIKKVHFTGGSYIIISSSTFKAKLLDFSP